MTKREKEVLTRIGDEAQDDYYDALMAHDEEQTNRSRSRLVFFVEIKRALNEAENG